MLTLKASVATAILLGTIATTAGITYVATKTTVAMSCPVPSTASNSAGNRGIPLGPRLPENQGEKF